MSSTTNPPAAPSLPTAWVPAEVEPELYRRWVERGYFTADPASAKPGYSVVLPPPNVTGNLHIGHAQNHAIIDAITRRKRMQGYDVLWLPGTDHAGIATQSVVEKQLDAQGTNRRELGREAFVERVWQWKAESGGNITRQMRRLGSGVDWTRERFTMDEGLSRAVQTIFKALFDAGLIYRAERLVNWSPVLRTAISDIEVTHKEVEGELVSFRYGDVDADGKPTGPSVVVATTRLETMVGDTAIAVHPEDERYRDLVGTTLAHPFLDRRIPVVADSYVDPEFGTGAVKITPAHDPNDFALGQRHDLPMPTVMDEAGRIAGTGTQFDGLDRFEARAAIREALAAQGRIVAEKRPYLHSVGHSERSGEPIEPRLSKQWWVKVEELAKAAGDAVRDGQTTIHPAALEPRWFDWVDNMHDWTISRQLWWGHRIPVYYGPAGEVVCVGPDDEIPAGYVQDPDVLDTWFSSGLWPFSTLGWPAQTPELQKYYPTSVLVTAYDIIFFWVARMMMFGTFVGTHAPEGTAAVPGPVPFTDVLLHGLIRDAHGQKMSKSKGNGIDPLEWADEFGTDALRFTLLRGANPGTDLSVGVDHAAASRNFVTKIFNATKFALMHGARPGELPDRAELTDADRWILGRLDEVIADTDAGFDTYEFSKSFESLYHFLWDEVCDWYLEIAKVQLGQLGADNPPATAENTRLVLGVVWDTALRLLHPAMPFVTEALWTVLTGGETVVTSAWPGSTVDQRATEAAGTGRAVLATVAAPRVDAAASRRITDVQKLVTDLRRFRADQGLKPAQRVPGRITGLEQADIAGQSEVIRVLSRLEEPEAEFNATARIEVRLSGATVLVEVDTSGAIDFAAERRRLDKDLAAAEKERDQTTAKLANAAFLAKAPEPVVEKIRGRQAAALAEVERITRRLEELPAS